MPFVPQLLCIYYNKQAFDYQLFIEGIEGFYGEETEWGKKSDAQLAREIEVALPVELSREDQITWRLREKCCMKSVKTVNSRCLIRRLQTLPQNILIGQYDP